MNKTKIILLLYCLASVSCLKTDEDFKKHMLIHEGLYRIGNDSTKTIQFNKDGTGKEVDWGPSSIDTMITEFTWNTSDWYHSTTVIEYSYHKRYLFKIWEEVHSGAVQPVRNISDSMLEACRWGLGFDDCQYGSPDYWESYIKILNP